MGGGMFNMDFKSMRREAEKGGICERKSEKGERKVWKEVSCCLLLLPYWLSESSYF